MTLKPVRDHVNLACIDGDVPGVDCECRPTRGDLADIISCALELLATDKTDLLEAIEERAAEGRRMTAELAALREREQQVLAPEPGDIRMDAYYYGFEQTGVGIIDRILSAVATAGKGSHHTEFWSDENEYVNPSYEQRIQNAANAAAEQLRSALAVDDVASRIRWVDLFGIDPEYTEGVPVDEWLETNRGEA